MSGEVTIHFGRLGQADQPGTRAHIPACVLALESAPPEQAKEVGKMAAGVIVGTACVRTIGESEMPVETAMEFAKSFSKALR